MPYGRHFCHLMYRSIFRTIVVATPTCRLIMSLCQTPFFACIGSVDAGVLWRKEDFLWSSCADCNFS